MSTSNSNTSIIMPPDLPVVSLDILLCEGFGKLSQAIKKTQALAGAPSDCCHITHIASIYEPHPRLKSNFTNMVFESTTVNAWKKPPVKGTQTSLFNHWLANYNGHVWLRRFDFTRDLIFFAEDTEFVNAKIGTPYESGIPGFFELGFCGLKLDKYIRKIFPDFKPFATKNLHCSESTAQRLLFHNMFNAEWKKEMSCNRMPPWMWLYYIDKYIDEPLSAPIQLK